MVDLHDTARDGSISDKRHAEIKYQKKLNRRMVATAMPGFFMFAAFFFYRGNVVQGTIFVALFINALVTFIWGGRLTDIRQMATLKLVGTGIAFSLLAGSLIAGLLSQDVYISYPWIFIYPMAVLLMYGERIGIIYALIFCLTTVVILWVIHLPPWDELSMRIFKCNSIVALIFIYAHSLSAERARVRMRNNLLDARNKYKSAEERQRQTNEELKSEIQMRVQSERALSQSEIRYRALFEESAVSLWEEDFSKVKECLDGLPQEAVDDMETYLNQTPDLLNKCLNSSLITAVNRATLKLYGAEDQEHLLKNISIIFPSNVLGIMAARLTGLYQTGSFSSELEAQTIHGRKLYLLFSSTIPAGYEQSWERVFTSVSDVTERVVMEEEKKRVDRQMQHTRQIQAIASLAGGIAHQFNNALAVISGNLDLLELNVRGHDQNMHFIGSLRTSSEKITHLTEQLLAYAQGGKYQPKDFPVNDLIKELLKKSEAIRIAPVKIQTHFEEDVYLASGDITQIRMVLEAVLTNAVEAMEQGGEEISVSSGKVSLSASTQGPEYCLKPGHYAVITVEDHGVGMDKEALQRVFEPFFTTKFFGRGLGMAAAYGIVRNHDGMIEVKSQRNRGTQVMIYLPSTPKPHDLRADRSQHAA